MENRASSASSSSDRTDVDRKQTRQSADTIGRAAARNSTTEEAVTSFGEPLHVSVTRGTSRFLSIQRSFSRPLSVGDEEAATGVAEAGYPGGFNLTGWLTGRQEQQGPPFTKRVGLVFDDLTVYGDDVANRHIGSLITPFYKIVKSAAHGFGLKKLFSAGGMKPLLRNMSGVVEDGEMLLVLGQPGAGCSTLLRVLGNRRGTYRKIEGSVSYGGLTPEEVEKRYRGEVAYNQEEDVHFSTLTVRKTLDFAIKCKTPNKNMLADREGYEKEFLDTLLDMYGLSGCADTIRKRVSIAEQVASGASIDIWDGSTRGLDSSSALDYVMVVEEGRELYFGPANKAVEYFASIGIYKPPRQTTSDFLTGVTQLHERTDFERCWQASSQYHSVKDEVSRFEARLKNDDRGNEIRHFVDQTKMGTEKSKLRRKSPYTTTFWYQLDKLVKRDSSYNAAFAIIVGTLFLNLPETSTGAFTRGGVLFFALLFNSLTAQAEIPKAVASREVVYKHKSFAMYHPAALSLAQTIVDIPFMAASVLRGFFRLIGNVSPNVDFGHTLSGIGLLFMILYSMHGWFIWIYFMSPLSWAFKALMANEFRHLELKCAGGNLDPAGAIPGQEYVFGPDYLEKGYSFHIKDMWKAFIIVCAYWILFVIMIAGVMEWVEFGNTGYSINVYKRYRPKVNAVHEDSARESKEALEALPSPGRSISYTVPVKGGNKQLLDDVSGYIKPGTMTALMGSSGAGKTTLLDSLSQRKTIGKLEGDILMNGAPQPASFRRITGYCEQLD
ncbi:hypothetical protein DL89DRAFT_295090, partial [Linderina pennispora]